MLSVKNVFFTNADIIASSRCRLAGLAEGSRRRAGIHRAAVDEQQQGAGGDRSPGLVVGQRRGGDHRDPVAGGGVLAEIDGDVLILEVRAGKRRLAYDVGEPRGAMGDKDEMQLALKGTQQRNYLALPGAWPGDIFTGTSTKAGIVMLWE